MAVKHSLFKLPNSCFQQDCSKKHLTTLHDGFQKAPPEEHHTNPSITVNMLTHESTEVYLQIIHVLILSSTEKTEKTCALLDTGGQSTLIRKDIQAEFNIHGNKTKIDIRSMKDQGEGIIVHEVHLEISSIVNNKMFEVKVNSLSQWRRSTCHFQKYLGLWNVSHLKGLKQTDIRSEDIEMLIGADIPEAFRQLDNKSGDRGEPIAIWLSSIC